MGEVDVEKLNEIYRFSNQFCDLMGLPFHFSYDAGKFETAIGIGENGFTERPLLDARWSDYKDSMHLFCPDVLDYNNKIIMELEELEGEPRKGARLAKKGHNADGLDKRTANRDLYYSLAKFRSLKIFDFEFAKPLVWKVKVADFLIKCWKNPLEKLV